MSKIINKSTGYLFLFIIILSAKAFPAVGYLTLNVETGYQVLLDSQLIADRSFENMPLIAGDYLLHAYNPNDLIWQNRGIIKKITIYEAETLVVDFITENKISIFSNPPGGLVYVDNQLIGQTPLQALYSYPDGKLFRVIKDGYQEGSFIKEAEKKNYTIKLKTILLPPALTVLQDHPNENNLKWLHEGLIITSLASSWLSFLFKREADANYEKYLRSARPSDMQKYYDRTIRFDHYAEISVGISLVSLGGYFYLLLTD